MNRHLYLTLFLLLAFAGMARSQSIWDKQHLQQVKQSIGTPFYAAAFEQLKAEADALLSKAPLSVMMKEKTAASGDKHDYLSQARYAWPNPNTPDGLPYINRDGVSNPEIERLDRIRLGEMAHRVITLTLAWYFSDDEVYALKAAEQLRTWFLDKATRMNPHLNYAQTIPGQNGGIGRCYGLIDGYSFVEMLDAVQLLEGSQAWKETDSRQLKRWFARLTKWMLQSPQGREEDAGANNHSIAYDAQMIAFSLYAGMPAEARRVMEQFDSRRLQKQIAADGSQPHELRRTLAFHYSWYNLKHIIDILLMARHQGIDLGVEKVCCQALDFLCPYVAQGRNAWPYPQISGWDSIVQRLLADLYRTAHYLDVDEAHVQCYDRLYADYRVLNVKDRFNLLYVDATMTDQAFAHAARQLSVAMADARQDGRKEANAARRKVFPRSLQPDGSLALVAAGDWCSGFFAGSLWSLYEYTHDEAWRRQAISWTWPVEEAKEKRTTHDLGFMIGCSFGRAWQQTGERSYRDVVMEASSTLIRRFNPQVGCIRSWDFNRDRWDYPVIIDNMMNLEMLFEATRLSGDSTYWQVAVSHANTTLKHHFRPDASSYHVVDYNPESGAVRGKCTHQGFADDSYWSRGQGWGLYGYTMCYRYTHDEAYLAHARRIADFFLSLPNMPADGIPYWDMKMPSVVGCTLQQVNPDIPRDASAAAIVASALYELSTYVDADASARYRAAADHMLRSLYEHYRAPQGSHHGFLLLHSTGHHPGGSEIDVPLNYADYYYLEALLRQSRQAHRPTSRQD